MARELRFTTYTSSEDLEPIEVWIGPPDGEQMFRFRPMIAGTSVMDLLAGVTESSSAAEAARATRQLLDVAVLPEDHDKFFEFVSDPDNMVGPTTFEDIAVGLAQEYMKVPTKQEQNSSNGSAPSGSGRGAASSKAAGKTSKK